MIRVTSVRTTQGLILLSTLALLLGCSGSTERGAQATVDPQAAVLHAGDLPRGYREGDDTVCGIPSATEGDWPQLESLFWETQPNACAIELQRIWAPEPGQPGGVTSAAFVFSNAEDAERGYGAQVELLRFTASLDARRNQDAELGDEAQLVRGDGLNDPATAVVWRSGSVVALLAVEPADEDAALDLARHQQDLIEGGSKPAPPVDALELELDDPGLAVPVYWLGRTFDPGEGLPPIVLREIYASGGASLDYSAADPNRHGGVSLVLSPPASWQTWRRNPVGRLVWDSPCARKTTVLLASGHAEIFEGYGASRPLKEPCPTSEPDRVVAHIYLDRVVVTVNMPNCYRCAAAGPDRNPYETVAGMTAVARGLKLRQRS